MQESAEIRNTFKLALIETKGNSIEHAPTLSVIELNNDNKGN